MTLVVDSLSHVKQHSQYSTFYRVDIMVADALAPCIARVSAAMILT